MAEYTYKDVIIDPNDPRVEIGKEYYFGNNPGCLLRSISQLSASEGTLVMKDSAIEAQSSPFMSSEGEWFVCIIRKKEPEKKWVPFDLTKEEDRARLRGAWVRVKERTSWEEQITSLNSIFIFLGGDGEDGIKPDYLFNHYEFVDGSPCGILKGVTDD